jgi:hypothetical protein
MVIGTNRHHALIFTYFVLLVWMPALAQLKPESTNYSGMYSFLRDGEFVQITVEDQGHVIGFVSRYADPEGEGGFVNHFFKSGNVEGNRLSFTTETVNGVSFDFRGTIERGEGATWGDEGYYVIKGNLIENTSDKTKKSSSTTSEVAFKSFPKDIAPVPGQKN